MSYLRNHKLLLVIIGALLVANIGLLYFFVLNKPQTTHKSPTPEEMRLKAIERVKNEVGFNDEQAKMYDSLRSNQFKNMRPLFEDLTKSKEDFFALIYKEGVPDSMVNSYSSKIGEKQMALDISTFRYLQSIKALCTEEQKPKMDTFIKQIVKRIINQRRPSDKKERK